MSFGDADIVIVGAGLAGAATAYHLARRSDDRILILEKEDVAGAHSSGRSAAIVRVGAVEPGVRGLIEEGGRAIREGTLAEFDRHGIVLLGLGDDDVRPMFPRARGRGLWFPDDGIVDVAALLHSYLAGLDISFNTSVESWRRAADRILLRTSRGEISCRILVNAAGPWAGVFGGLPITPLNRHLFATPPLDWVDPRWPTVWDGNAGLYFRPESGGLLLSACDEKPAAPGDYQEDPTVVEQLAEKLERLQPDLGELAIQSSWVGQRTFAPDRNFVIGFDPRDDGLFHVAGLGGHGVTASPAVGALAASLILGDRVGGANAFSPSRLKAGGWRLEA